MSMRSFLAALAVAACAAPPPPPHAPRSAPAPAETAPPPPQPAAAAPFRTAAPAAVPPPPAECRAFGAGAEGCAAASGSLVERLARALEADDAARRDRALACVEGSASEHAAALRALRADLGPRACADAIVTPFLESHPGALEPNDESALIGLSIAGQLARLDAGPPALSPPFDKARFFDFFERALKPWMLSQALAIGALSQRGAKLKGYGKAVAAIEAGAADLRFVEAVRAVPLPAELAHDPEVKNVYYASLDEALEPRKARGRDAALVALRALAELGVIADPRLERARSLLAELYAGSRLDALDYLLLPEPPPLELTRPEHALAARLPTFYAARWLGAPRDPADVRLLRAFLERGLPPQLRAALDAAALGPEARLAYALIELRRGRAYFAAPAFRRAAELVGSAAPSAAGKLVYALGRALEAAPKDGVELMLSSTRLSAPLGTSDALEALAKGAGPYRGEAEFDAAYLRFIAPPADDVKFWQDLEQRFRRAEQRLKRPEARKTARELAEGAFWTARTLVPKPAP